MPQGSVLGPILFALYVAPVGDIISAYSIQHHQYAGDTQLFFALKAATIDSDIHLLESCSQAVKKWFLEYDLILNADKLKVMLVGTGAQLRKIDETQSVKVADVALPTINQLKSLGVIVDSQLKLDYCNAIHTRITKEFDRCSSENSELFGACCTSTVEVHERHSTTEIIALAANSTQNTVQASCCNL